MALIRIEQLEGMAPIKAPRKLGPSQSQLASNSDLVSGELRPIRATKTVDTPTKTGTIQTIYRLVDTWLHWTTDVDVVTAPIADDDTNRIYYTGDGPPQVTNYSMATTGGGTDYPLDSYQLGIPAPATAPSVAITGGSSGIPESRSYVYTYVTQWGEESAPSPVTTYDAAHDDATQWDISGMDTGPVNSGGINNAVHSGGVVTVTTADKHLLRVGESITIAGVVGMTDLNGTWTVASIPTTTTFTVALSTAQTYTADPGDTWTRDVNLNTSSLTQRIYRTVAGKYYLVAEQSPSATYTDTTADSDLGEEIPSTLWDMPPIDLTALIAHPNGYLVGISDNKICFSEPYIPYAWPETYQIPLSDTPIALGVAVSTIVVGTDAQPRAITGYHPDSVTVTNIDLEQACLSKRSMQTIGSAVIYAGTSGLISVSPSGVQLVTSEHLDKRDWLESYNPTSMIGLHYNNRYYGFFSNAGVLENEAGALVFDPIHPPAAISQLGFEISAGFSDIADDSMFFMEGTHIKEWRAGSSELTFQWKSKVFTTPKPVNFGAAMVRHSGSDSTVTAAERIAAIDGAVAGVDADATSGDEDMFGELNGDQVNGYPVNGGPYLDATAEIDSGAVLYFKLYADGELKHTQLVSTSDPFRLPSGYLSDTWEIEISGVGAIVHEVLVAQTMTELQKA